jgi:hypothetical protein
VGTGANSLLDHAKEGKMRRVTLILAAMGLMVSLFAAAAYAAQIEGTDRSDDLFESNRGDWIAGRARADNIDASKYPLFPGMEDTDKVHGNKGQDILNVEDGDTADTVNGGKGVDTCDGDTGDRFINCENMPPV